MKIYTRNLFFLSLVFLAMPIVSMDEDFKTLKNKLEDAFPNDIEPTEPISVENVSVEEFLLGVEFRQTRLVNACLEDKKFIEKHHTALISALILAQNNNDKTLRTKINKAQFLLYMK